MFRIIRTNSGNFREDNENHLHSSFQRGGLRATATGSKTSIKPLRYVVECCFVRFHSFVSFFSVLETTFSRWQTEQIVNWLYGIGLGQYASECRKHFKNGLQLLHATPQELEKVNIQLFLFVHNTFVLFKENWNEKSIAS